MRTILGSYNHPFFLSIGSQTHEMEENNSELLILFDHLPPVRCLFIFMCIANLPFTKTAPASSPSNVVGQCA